MKTHSVKEIKRMLAVVLALVMMCNSVAMDVSATTWTSDKSLEVAASGNDTITLAQLVEKVGVPVARTVTKTSTIYKNGEKEVNVEVPVTDLLYHLIVDGVTYNNVDNQETPIIFTQSGTYTFWYGDAEYDYSVKEGSVLKSKLAAYEAALADKGSKEDAVTIAQNTFGEAEKAYNAAAADLTLKQTAESLAKTAYDNAVTKLNNAEESRKEAAEQLETYKKALDTAQSAYDKLGSYFPDWMKQEALNTLNEAKEKYNQQLAIVNDAEAYKAQLEAEKTAAETAYNNAKAATAAAETVKAEKENAKNAAETALTAAQTAASEAASAVESAWAALETYAPNAGADVAYTRKSGYIIPEAPAGTEKSFAVNVYNLLTVSVDKSTIAEAPTVTVANVNGTVEGAYKVYTTNNTVTITYPHVTNYTVSLKVGGATVQSVFDETSGTYTYTLTEGISTSTSVEVLYAEVGSSKVEYAETEGVKAITVSDGNKSYGSETYVKAGTQLTVTAQAEENWKITGVTVKDKTTGENVASAAGAEVGFGVSSTDPTTYSITAEAVYTLSTMNINVSDENGLKDSITVSSGTIDGEKYVTGMAPNTSVTVTVPLKDGYKLAKVKLTCGTSDTDVSYSKNKNCITFTTRNVKF